jgi:CheY-like chemotaxis protein
MGTGLSKIYLVDDDASIRRALGRVMASAGFAHEAFSSAEDFLATADGAGVCVVADARLPGMSGPELIRRAAKKPNILVIWGDDIGTWNISHNNRGMMGYKTPNIDRIAAEGVAFTDYYAQQSCTAGRAAFISGSVPVRNGMTKVGMPKAPKAGRRPTAPWPRS